MKELWPDATYLCFNPKQSTITYEYFKIIINHEVMLFWLTSVTLFIDMTTDSCSCLPTSTLPPPAGTVGGGTGYCLWSLRFQLVELEVGSGPNRLNHFSYVDEKKVTKQKVLTTLVWGHTVFRVRWCSNTSDILITPADLLGSVFSGLPTCLCLMWN